MSTYTTGSRRGTDVRRLLSQRSDVLVVLVEGATEKGDLTDDVDVSRSTIDRAVRQLKANGLVDGRRVWSRRHAPDDFLVDRDDE